MKHSAISTPTELPALRDAIGLDLEEWESWVVEQGEKKFRAKQIVEWIFKKRVDSFDEMTNLSVSLRDALKTQFRFASLDTLHVTGSNDTTRKFLFKLQEDGRLIETVLIPASPALYGEKSDRRTVCVSSQVGCAYACKFCASGLAGFTRNLSAAEIVSQVMTIEKTIGKPINNLVFMGMGEPLANLTNLLRAIQILNAHWGLEIGARHMTVSTSGLAPQIEKLAQQPIPIRLALSLHGATDEVRDQIMPVNSKYPLDRLFQSLRVWQQHKKQRITFEYILIKDVNDSLDQARVLASRARSLNAKVNLIPYNKVDGLEWDRPSEPQQEAFLSVLKNKGAVATLRREKGHDIDAACGQLRLREEKDLEIAV